MKKLAVCITAYEPGGQSVVVEETTKRFAKYYDVDMYCVYSTKSKPQWIKNLYHIKPWLNKYIPIINKKFIEQIKSQEYDVIHCHDSLPFMDAFHKSGIDYVVTCHGHGYWWIREGLISKIDCILSLIFYKNSYKKAKRIFAISKYIQEWLKTTYRVESTIIYNGVPTDKFYILNSIEADRSPTLVYFGQISYRKGIWDLLFAIKNLKVKYPNILLNLGGFGDEKFIYNVKKYIYNNKLENNIKILGYVSTEKQVEYYNSCDAAITSSYWEGFCLPIIEAYQCNKPIFVRNNTAMKEFVNDERFRFSTVEEMINKLDYYFSNKSEFNIIYTKILDPKVFNWDYSADQYLKMFE